MIQYFGCYGEVTIYRNRGQVQNFGQKQHSELIQTTKWQGATMKKGDIPDSNITSYAYDIYNQDRHKKFTLNGV